MVDRGGLENRCGSRGHRGFESHPLRSLCSLRGCIDRDPLRSQKSPKRALFFATRVQKPRPSPLALLAARVQRPRPTPSKNAYGGASHKGTQSIRKPRSSPPLASRMHPTRGRTVRVNRDSYRAQRTRSSPLSIGYLVINYLIQLDHRH